ncbi:hypothetical protein CN163_12835 [Sinorhizobium meliloti]|nr:hypothetical protein CN163_12835 [Sinorhizobium meliloti]
MRGSVGAACPFSPPAGRRWRQPDEGRTLPGDAGTIRAPLVIHRIHTKIVPALVIPRRHRERRPAVS